MVLLSLRTLRKKAKFLVWLLVLHTSSGVILLAEHTEQKFITCHDPKLTQENDLTPNDILSILESEDALLCLGKTGQELFVSLYNHPTKNQHSALLQKCYTRILDGYTTVSYKDLLNVIEEIYAILEAQENQKHLAYLQELVQATKPCAVTFSSDAPELPCKNGQHTQKSNAYYELYLAPDAHIAPTLDVAYQAGDTEIKTVMTVYTAGIAPSSISSININAKNLFVSSQAGVTPRAEKAVFVSPGTTLLNNIGPWKIANPDGTTPLSDGTKILNVSNFFFDPNGTTEFGGNVLIDGNLTVDGTTIFGSNNYTFSSDVFINKDATLFVSEIDPRSPGTTTTMSGNVNVNQNLVVDGNLTVLGSSNIGGGANYTFSSDVFIDNNATLFVSEIDPRSPSTTTGFSGNVNLAQNLIVTGATTLVGNTIEHGTFTVTGSTSLIGAVGLASTLNVAGATTLNSLAVTNNETVGGNLNVTGATTFVGNTIDHGTLTVTGSTSLIGSVGLASTLNVAGATTLNSLTVTNNETVGGNLRVTGATTFVGNTIEHGTLTVTGSTSLIGAVGLASTLNVAGATTLNSLTVTNNETVGGNVRVTGATTLVGNTIEHGTLTVTGSTSLMGDVSVSGILFVNEIDPINPATTTNFSGNVSILNNNSLTVTGTSFLHDVVVTGSSTIIFTTIKNEVSEMITVTGKLLVNQVDPVNLNTNFIDDRLTTSFSGQVSITGTTLLSRPLIVNSNETVAGLASLNGGINVNSGNFTVDTSGDITAAGLSRLNGGINVNSGNFTVDTSGDITAAGLSSLNGGINVNSGNMTVDTTGNITTFANLKMPGTTSSSAGVIDFGNTSFIHNYPLGANNVFLGNSAGNFSLSSSANTGIGAFSLTNVSSGEFNTAVGFGSEASVNGGSHNTSMGYSSLQSVNAGSDNTAIGFNSLRDMTTGNNNIAIGSDAGLFHTMSDSNNIDIASAGNAGDNGVIRIGIPGTQKSCFIAGITGVSVSGSPVLVSGSGQLGASNDVNIVGNLSVGGATTLVGDTIEHGALTITGSTSFIGPVSSFLVTGTVTLGGLDVTGSTSLQGTLDVYKDTNLYESLTVAAGNFSVDPSGDITAAGLATLNGGINVNAGTFTVDTSGDLFANGGIGTNGDINASGNIFSAGNIGLPLTNGVVGIYQSGGFPFIHNYPTGGNTFLGINAGNFTIPSPENTGIGAGALEGLTFGLANTAVGDLSMNLTTVGFFNAAVGASALSSNTTGNNNTALGYQSLGANTTAANNTAVGIQALVKNTTGFGNNALGYHALDLNTTGSTNVAVGYNALLKSSTGNQNIALGSNITGAAGAGSGLTSGSNNIYIGSDSFTSAGSASETGVIRMGFSHTLTTSTFVSGIYGRGLAAGAGGLGVFINSTGQLGTAASSKKYKKDIENMGEATSKLLNLRPVSFKYNKDIDPDGLQQYGLIAEEVAHVAPELVVYSPKDGTPETVRYHLLTPMLLNEYQKQAEKLMVYDKKFSEQDKKLNEQHDELKKMRERLQMLEKSLSK